MLHETAIPSEGHGHLYWMKDYIQVQYYKHSYWECTEHSSE